MARKRNFAQELRTQQAAGATIVCSMLPYLGMPMAHAPRKPHDPYPWVPADQYTKSGSYSGMYRYSSRQCHAAWLHYDHGDGQPLCGERLENGHTQTDDVSVVKCPPCLAAWYALP